VAGGHQWDSISVGDQHTCGTVAGVGYCWGYGDDGRTGSGTFQTTNSPMPILGGISVDYFSASFVNTCAHSTTNDVYCWGSNSGNRMATSPNKFLRRGISLPEGNALSYTGYYRFTCALSDSGNAYCWGMGDRGQLGNNSTEHSITPVLVSGGHKWSTVAAGGFHTCALNKVGKIYCWGSKSSGKVGDGTSSGISGIPNEISGGKTWVSLADSGGSFNCALDNLGAAYCWGINGDKQIGNNSTINVSVPTLVLGGHTWKFLESGLYHSCAIDSFDDAYCWGRDSSGQLGFAGSTVDQGIPVLVAGGYKWKSLSLYEDSSCGITTGDQAYCWGDGASNKMGDGSDTNNDTPDLVSGGLSWQQISLGLNHTCGITLSGDAYCWGNNSWAQLGDEIPYTINSISSPTMVPGGFNWLSIFSGYRFTYGIRRP